MKEKPVKHAVSKVCMQKVREFLWPPDESEGRVFAILDGARNRQVFAAVDAAHLERTCLYSVNLRWPGEELPWKLIGAAPYLVEMEKDADLTSFVILNGWQDHWGIFCRSHSGLKQLRRHFRDLLVVTDHLNRRLMFRYYDPRVIRAYLPTCRIDELRTFFGPVDELIVPGKEPCTAIRYRIEGNKLAEQIVELTPGRPSEAGGSVPDRPNRGALAGSR